MVDVPVTSFHDHDHTMAMRGDQSQPTDTETRKGNMTDTSYDSFDEPTPEDATGAEVEVIDGKPILPDRTAFDKMIEQSRSQAMEDPKAVSAAIVARILEASTVAEILAPAEVRHARELLDTPIVVESLHFNQSDFDDGPGFYAVVDVTDPETGDRFAVSCGGSNVMAQLYALAANNLLPCPVKFTQARRPTRQGYYPLWLVEA